MNKDEEEKIEIADKIIVPYGFGEKYKNSPQWAMFADRIEEAPKPKWTLAERIRMKLRHFVWKIKNFFSKPMEEDDDRFWDEYDWGDDGDENSEDCLDNEQHNTQEEKQVETSMDSLNRRLFGDKIKQMTLKDGSELEYACATCYCYLPIFNINGIKAQVRDFGTQDDIDPENAEDYGCGDMQFIPNTDPTEEILSKYLISRDEYKQVCKELDCLSFGCCGWCI